MKKEQLEKSKQTSPQVLNMNSYGELIIQELNRLSFQISY